MVMPKWYDDLVEKLGREKEAAERTKGEFTGKGGEIFAYETDGKEVKITGTDKGAKYLTDGPHELPEAIQLTGYVTKSGRVMKHKPGRKPKVK